MINLFTFLISAMVIVMITFALCTLTVGSNRDERQMELMRLGQGASKAFSLVTISLILVLILLKMK